ncbi:hypothetical protein EIP86_011557 [Pleurotus ostreatoroseus]|nr:hypothetical protein EIP86_011557 [Pleurotus ostreatoroseus]
MDRFVFDDIIEAGEQRMDALLCAVNKETLAEYREYFLQKLDDQMRQLYSHRWTVENARSWLNVDAFDDWMAEKLQPTRAVSRSPTKSRTATPSTVSRSGSIASTPRSSQRRNSLNSSRQLQSPRLPRPDFTAGTSTPKIERTRKSVEVISLLSDDEEPDGSNRNTATPRPTTSRTTAVKDEPQSPEIVLLGFRSNTPTTPTIKRHRHAVHVKSEPEDLADIDQSDLDMPRSHVKKAKARHNTTTTVSVQCKSATPATATIQITRFRKVSQIIPLDEIPWCFSVPRSDGESFAYLLDLTHKPIDGEWKDDRGNLLSIAAMIKKNNQDSWGGGTAGSNAQLVKVYALDNAQCRYAEHVCQGCFICDRADPQLINSERYEPDEEESADIYQRQCRINEVEYTSVQSQAAAFYNQVQRTSCKWETEDGAVVHCPGKPVIRPMKERNCDGKTLFIGCSGWKRTSSKTENHRFETIPINVDQDLVKELFQNNGQFKQAPSDSAIAGGCATVVPRRSGAKGKHLCPYTHILDDGSVVQGRLILRECKTKIRIWYPKDLADRRAIVILEGAHSHPTPARSKLSRQGEIKYMECIKAHGTIGATVSKVDKGCDTPAAFDPALANTRKRRELVYKAKRVQNPLGTGLQGVFAQYQADLKKPLNERYIHRFIQDGDVFAIFTFLPALAHYLIDASAVLCDNTYKRIHGEAQEWEVVIWLARINMRLTVARIYSNSETRETYRQLWSGLWDLVENVTGRKIQFKFMHGSGIRAIVVDGNKAQVQGCGDSLAARNNPGVSGVAEHDPEKLVQYIIKLCKVHIDRNNDQLAQSCPPDVMTRVRDVANFNSHDQVKEFGEWCEQSPHKALRDWWADKKPHPWWFSCVSPHLSLISKEDWLVTPHDTNMNESAHPYTNAYTGTKLSLLEGIQAAYELDRKQLSKIQETDRTFILPNHRNTMSQRMHANTKRKDARREKAAARHEASETLENLERQIAEQDAARKAAMTAAKELRAQRKILQETSGVKRKRNLGKGKAPYLPTVVAEEDARTHAEECGSAEDNVEGSGAGVVSDVSLVSTSANVAEEAVESAANSFGSSWVAHYDQTAEEDPISQARTHHDCLDPFFMQSDLYSHHSLPMDPSQLDDSWLSDLSNLEGCSGFSPEYGPYPGPLGDTINICQPSSSARLIHAPGVAGYEQMPDTMLNIDNTMAYFTPGEDF